MKLISTAALAAALAVGGIALAGLQPAEAKKTEAKAAKYSAAISQNIPVAQKATDAGTFDAAKTAIAAAEAGMQTPDDRFAVGVAKIQLAQKNQDQTMLSQGIDQALASGSEQLTPDLQKQLLGNQATFAYQAHDYAKADAAFTKVSALDPGSGDTLVSLAEIKNLEGRTAESFPLIDRAIAAKKQTGQPVSEDWYKRAFALAVNGKDVANANRFGPQWVAAYPSPTNWRDALITYRDMNRVDPQAELDIFRLMRAAKALNGERDFFEYANSAYNKGLPGEAAAVIGEGTGSNMIKGTSPALTELKSLSGTKIAADRASLTGSATRAQAAATGKPAASTADAYLGYGDYAKAASLYQTALQKGGVDTDAVNTRLGIALARSGQKAAALEAFGKVSTPARKGIADYWVIWVNAQA